MIKTILIEKYISSNPHIYHIDLIKNTIGRQFKTLNLILFDLHQDTKTFLSVQSNNDRLSVVLNRINLNAKFIGYYHFHKSSFRIQKLSIAFNDTKN